MSNVSPVHSKLQPQVLASEDDDTETEHIARVRSECNTPQRSTFPHNTYHGPTKHVR